MEPLFESSVNEVTSIVGLTEEEVRVLEDADQAAVLGNTQRKNVHNGRSPPSRARLVAPGSGSGSNMTIDSVFELSGDRPTRMTWRADAEITGVMAGIGSALLKGFAAKKVGEISDGISRSLERR